MYKYSPLRSAVNGKSPVLYMTPDKTTLKEVEQAFISLSNYQDYYHYLEIPVALLSHFRHSNGQSRVNIRQYGASFPSPNIAIGCRVSDQATLNAAVPILLEVPASKYFVVIDSPSEFIRVSDWSKPKAGRANCQVVGEVFLAGADCDFCGDYFSCGVDVLVGGLRH